MQKSRHLSFWALAITTMLGLLTLFWAPVGCKKNPVAPEPRNLTWSVDTLQHPDNWQTGLFDIWGSSPKDVYVAGTANTTRGILWHYDGRQWKDIKISITEGGPIRGSIDFEDIYGFGKDDVWLAGKRAHFLSDSHYFTNLVVHFNGATWKEIEAPAGHGLTQIWGTSSSDLWFAGINGSLVHYDGVAMRRDSIPLAIPPDPSSAIVATALNGSPAEAYMVIIDWGSTHRYLLKYQTGAWAVLDSTFYNVTSLWRSPAGTYYLTGESTRRLRNGTWELFLEGSQTVYTNSMAGPSEENLILVGESSDPRYRGAAYHYNGRDAFHLTNLDNPDFFYSEVTLLNGEVFVVATSSRQSIVLHGH